MRKKKRISRLEIDSQGLCDRMEYAENKIDELQLKVVELEKKITQQGQTGWVKYQWDTVGGMTRILPTTCPLCHIQYYNNHVCWTVNPSASPITFDHSILNVPKIT